MAEDQITNRKEPKTFSEVCDHLNKESHRKWHEAIQNEFWETTK